MPGAPAALLGLGVTILVTLVHLSGNQRGAVFQNVTTIMKLVLIAVLIVAGLVWGQPQNIPFLPSAADAGYITGAPFAIGLVFVLYAYSGWNAATYIAGEIDEPHRNLPRSIIAALLIVTGLYVLLNAVFLYTTPIEELRGQLDVGLMAGQQYLSDAGGRLVAALICVGLVSSISAMMWIGPRVTMVMGEDIPLLEVFSRKTKNGVPAAALLFQLAVVAALMLTQSFEAVLDFIQFALTFQLVPYGSWCHRAKIPAAGPAEAVQGLGLSGDAVHIFGCNAVCTCSPRNRAPGAIPGKLLHDACGFLLTLSR